MNKSYKNRKLRNSLGNCFRRYTALLLALLFFSASTVVSYADVFTLGDSNEPENIASALNESVIDLPETVSVFDMVLADGYTDVTDDGVYVWMADTYEVGHTFMFDVAFRANGSGYIEPGAVKIAVLDSVLRNGYGVPVDSYVISVPHTSELTVALDASDDSEGTNDWSYYEDELGRPVITNIKAVNVEQEYHFNVWYSVTEEAFNHESGIKLIDGIHAELGFEFEGVNAEAQSPDLKIEIDTSAIFGGDTEDDENNEDYGADDKEITPDTDDNVEVAESLNEESGNSVSVSKFDMEIIDGYTRTEDGGYVWEANNSDEGHKFMFNILFQASGEGNIEPGGVRIKIPAHILKSKSGAVADEIDMSVPHRSQVPPELEGMIDWVYEVDSDGNIIIYNISPIPAGQAFQFNVGYTTREKTFDYTDMEFFDGIQGELDFNPAGVADPVNDDSAYPPDQHQESTEMKVAVDTSVNIKQTKKNKPTGIIKSWNPIWGDPPSDFNVDEYYYLIWDVESAVDEKSTQYYDFSLSDYDFKCVKPSEQSFGDLMILGYHYQGQANNNYSLDPNTVYNQNIFGTRHDQVLTAIPRELYEQMDENDEIILENNVKATVHPSDNIDKDTDASANQTYPLKKPKFGPPIGSNSFVKNGGRRYFQLESFIDPNGREEIMPFEYEITAKSYSYDQTYDYDGTIPDGYTVETYNPAEDYRNYGKKTLHYEIEDNQVSLEGYMGDFHKEDKYAHNPLQKGDYYFTSVDFTYDITMVAKENPELGLPGNQSFNIETKSFNFTKPIDGSGYEVSFDVFGEYDGVYQKIATVNAYSGSAGTVYENEYAKVVTTVSGAAYGFKVTFKDNNCTGYKIVSSDDYYYSAIFTAKPCIQLEKNNTELLKWINEKYEDEKAAENNADRVTELQVTNAAGFESLVAEGEDDDGNTVYRSAFNASATGTDYQNESKRQSYITKAMTRAENNALYKRVEISWKIDISEQVIVDSSGRSSIPVTQYGGEFFDLLPRGSSVDMSTVRVQREGNADVEFTATTLPGADNRVLLSVYIASDQPGTKYTLYFTSYHSWEDIATFGPNILNPAAFVTGNADMSDTSNGRGSKSGNSIDLMVDSINSTGKYDEILGSNGKYSGPTYGRTIFSYEPYDINAAVMSNVGVNKNVKNALEGTYTTQTVIDSDSGDYSYKLSYVNGQTTKSVNNVFVDFLEIFSKASKNESVSPMWKGTLKSIDVSNLLSKYIIPRVYYTTDEFVYSTDEDLIKESRVGYKDAQGNTIQLVDSVQENAPTKQYIRDYLPTTTFDNSDGNEHWTLIPASLCDENGVYNLVDDAGKCRLEGISSLRDITAIAIDFTYANPVGYPDQIEWTAEDHPELTAEELAERNRNAKITTEYKYIMSLGESAYVILNLDNSQVSDPMSKDAFEAAYPDSTEEDYTKYLKSYNALNDIFIASDMFNRSQTSSDAQHNWLEQNYTTVSYRSRAKFYLKKVNADNTEETIGGITFNLTGTSLYGTVVNQTVTTTNNGTLEFRGLEAGTYILTEVDCGWDWQIDRTAYIVTVDIDKKVTVKPDLSLGEDPTEDEKNHNNSDNPFVLTNKPRAHADIAFDKKSFEKGTMTDFEVAGAVFMLSGISNYGNEILKTAVSDVGGRVFFENIEEGTYELKEIEAPEGYAVSNIVYTVRVDENNNWEITTSDSSLMEWDSSTGNYTIGNEKYQSFYLQKQSTQAVGKNDDVYLLDGAVFTLQGVTDDGKIINIESVSEYSADLGDGIAYFGNLEPGTYYLKEITPPVYTYTDSNGNTVEQRFYPDETVYTVTVTSDGVTIDGLEPATASDGETTDTIFNLYIFKNRPVAGQHVIVKKVWIDDLTNEERIAEVESPDIVISKAKPKPFENVYSYFDYNYINRRDGALATSMASDNNMVYFKRYTNKDVSFSDVKIKSTNKNDPTEYPKLLINGKDVGAAIISTSPKDANNPSPKPIYGWLDEKTKTYYWYTEATGAKLLTARSLFDGFRNNLAYVDLAGIDFSEAVSFENMFYNCQSLEQVHNLARPSNAETRNVSAKSMFYFCKNLGKSGTLNLTEFDTTGFTNMEQMFQDAFNHGGKTVINWGTALNTESVTTFNTMFGYCRNLTELRADPINADGVTAEKGFEKMFLDCTILDYIPKLIRTENANAPKGISAYQMFYSCQHLGERMKVVDLTEFNTTDITNMSNMFSQAFKFGSGTTIRWGHSLHTENVTTFESMFNSCTVLSGLIANELDASGVTAEKGFDSMFSQCTNLDNIPKLKRTENAAKPVNQSKGISAINMFYNCNNLGKTAGVLDFDEFNTKDITNMKSMFQSAIQNSVSESGVVIKWKALDTKNVTTFANMFDSSKSLTELRANVIDTSGVTESDGFVFMFGNSAKLDVIPKIVRRVDPNKSVSISARQMFYSCNQLGKSMEELDFTGFDTTGINNMTQMFRGAFSYGGNVKETTVLNWGDSLHTESVTVFSYMFNGCSHLKELNAVEINGNSAAKTTGIKNDEQGFRDMFSGCTNLVKLPEFVRSENAAGKDLSMSYMFSKCSALIDIDMSKFHTQGVTDMSSLFNECKALNSPDLSSFDTSSVTNMSGMFLHCYVITVLDLSNFNTSEVTNMANMFAQCRGLTSLTITSFDTSKVSTMAAMFDNCNQLTELDLSSFTKENLTNANTMFCNCASLKVIYANESFDLSVIAAGSNNMFMGDKVLEGGSGTKYSEVDDKIKNYGKCAHIDGGAAYPGYFTKKDAPQKSSLTGGSVKTSAVGSFAYGAEAIEESTFVSEAGIIEESLSVYETSTVAVSPFLFGMSAGTVSFERSNSFGLSEIFGVVPYADGDESGDIPSDGLDGDYYRNSKNHGNTTGDCDKNDRLIVVKYGKAIKEILAQVIAISDGEPLEGETAEEKSARAMEKLEAAMISLNASRTSLSLILPTILGADNLSALLTEIRSALSEDEYNSIVDKIETTRDRYAFEIITALRNILEEVAKEEDFAEIFAGISGKEATEAEYILKEAIETEALKRAIETEIQDNEEFQNEFEAAKSKDDLKRLLGKIKGDDAVNAVLKEVKDKYGSKITEALKNILKETATEEEFAVILNDIADRNYSETEEILKASIEKTTLKRLIEASVKDKTESATILELIWRGKDDSGATLGLVETVYEAVRDKKDNEWIYVFLDIVGEDFFAWEESIPDGYEGDFDNFVDENGVHRITQVKNGIATITNRMINLGSLILSKTVLNANDDNTDVSDQVKNQYIFEIELSSYSGHFALFVNAVYYQTSGGEKTVIPVLFVEGKATVVIQSGYTLRFDDLPIGSTYTVTELTDEEVISTGVKLNDTEITADNSEISGSNGETVKRVTVSGVIEKVNGSAEAALEYDNVIDADIRPLGEFKLKKLVENENDVSDPDTEYSFTIEFTNLVKNTEYSIYNADGKVVKTFKSDSDQKAVVLVSLKEKDVFTFADIPEGAKYRITEAASGAYVSSYVVTATENKSADDEDGGESEGSESGGLESVNNEAESNEPGENVAEVEETEPTVTESSANTSVGKDLSTSWQEVKPSTTATTTFTNRIVKTQSLSVRKTVIGEEPKNPDEESGKPGEGKKFRFVAEFSNLGAFYQMFAPGIGTIRADEYGNSRVEFYLQSGETVEFEKIPVGAKYVIYEDYNGLLIPYYEVVITDETTGQKQVDSAVPSTSTGEDIAKAVEAAQAVVDKAQSEYNTAESLLSYDKKALDSAIADAINLLTDQQKSDYADVIAAFTADNYAEYKSARDIVLALIPDNVGLLKTAEADAGNAEEIYAAALGKLASAIEAVKNRLPDEQKELYADSIAVFNENNFINDTAAYAAAREVVLWLLSDSSESAESLGASEAEAKAASDVLKAQIAALGSAIDAVIDELSDEQKEANAESIEALTADNYLYDNAAYDDAWEIINNLLTDSTALIEEAEDEINDKIAAGSDSIADAIERLNSAIAVVTVKLSEKQFEYYADIISVFTAENYASYQSARKTILDLIISDPNYEAIEAAITSAEEEVTESALLLGSANNDLELAKEILQQARGSSCVDGSIEINKDTDIEFRNIEPFEFTVTKTVTSKLPVIDETKEFHFKIQFMYNGIPFGGSYSAETTGNARITDSGYLTDDLSSLFTPDGMVYFVLRHGDTITFKNLPSCTTYTIVEEWVKDYEVKVTTETDYKTDEIEGRIASGTIIANTTAKYENHWDGFYGKLPATGSIGTKLIYQLSIILMLAGLAGTWLCGRKRRNIRA